MIMKTRTQTGSTLYVSELEGGLEIEEWSEAKDRMVWHLVLTRDQAVELKDFLTAKGF